MKELDVEIPARERRPIQWRLAAAPGYAAAVVATLVILHLVGVA